MSDTTNLTLRAVREFERVAAACIFLGMRDADYYPMASTEIINHIAKGGLASLSPDRSTWVADG